MCKAISERLYINFSQNNPEIKTIIVRYGNVLESTGSVIPIFKNILKSGNTTLPITHPDMTRFLMSLDDAVDLIQWAYENDTHGKITIPKMNSFKIVDIANAISQAYGVENPTLEYVGIRNGEKIHEEMISEEESIRTDDGKKNFLVSNSIINNNIWTYNSKDHTLAIDLVSNFLKEKGVFDNIEIYKKSAFKLY
jgi:FlaA1/EpsC-like NDP-sugar epimerase